MIWSMRKNDKSFLDTYKKTKVKTQNKHKQNLQVNISGGSSCLQRPQIKSLTTCLKSQKTLSKPHSMRAPQELKTTSQNALHSLARLHISWWGKQGRAKEEKLI